MVFCYVVVCYIMYCNERERWYVRLLGIYMDKLKKIWNKLLLRKKKEGEREKEYFVIK